MKIDNVELIVELGDITKITADAIVNAANSSLLGGGGVDGDIHREGGSVILEECKKIVDRQGSCPVGEAVITSAGKLNAKYVIHTVGPVWQYGKNNEEEKLAECYLNSLKIADGKGLESIAFSNISTGTYRFPKEKAVKIALDSVKKHFEKNKNSNLKKIIFVCYDDENYIEYESMLKYNENIVFVD